LGPRIAGPIWWLFQPLRWEAAFRNFAGGNLWWFDILWYTGGLGRNRIPGYEGY
jgi:hypothetical protein